MQTVLHELDELTGQVVQGLPGPVGLRRRDDGFVHPLTGEGGDALEQGAEQIKACKAEEPLDRAGQRTQRTGQHGDLGTVGGDLKVFVLAVFRLEAGYFHNNAIARFGVDDRLGDTHGIHAVADHFQSTRLRIA